MNRIAVLGDPAQEIVDWVRTNNVDLVMMPSHGYGPFRQLLLGSVTAKVLHDVPCAVWTTAHTGTAPDLQHMALNKILCAVDATPESANVMRSAAVLAKDVGADLRLVTVVPGVEAWPERQMDVEFEEQLRENAKQRMAELQASVNESFMLPVCVAVGPVADSVAQEAERHGADACCCALVIGRGAIHETLGRLRTHCLRLDPSLALSGAERVWYEELMSSSKNFRPDTKFRAPSEAEDLFLDNASASRVLSRPPARGRSRPLSVPFSSPRSWPEVPSRPPARGRSLESRSPFFRPDPSET